MNVVPLNIIPLYVLNATELNATECTSSAIECNISVHNAAVCNANFRNVTEHYEHKRIFKSNQINISCKHHAMVCLWTWKKRTLIDYMHRKARDFIKNIYLLIVIIFLSSYDNTNMNHTTWFSFNMLHFMDVANVQNVLYNFWKERVYFPVLFNINFSERKFLICHIQFVWNFMRTFNILWTFMMKFSLYDIQYF